jgi:choline dehydrogenase-like flavoprotein
MLPIVIIGAGAGGGAVATVLAENNIPVILIERGNLLDKKDVKTDQYDYEVDNAPWDVNPSKWYGDVSPQYGQGIGGSTLYFQAVSHLPSESILKSWGVNLSQFRKSENIVRDFLQIAGDRQPSHRLNPVSQHLLNSAKKNGWNAQPAPVAILSRPSEGRPACNRCGLCIYGCLPGDKSSVDNTWFPRLKNNKNVRTITEATVDRINLVSKERAGSVDVTTSAGKQTIQASSVIVAAGALETPYLLNKSIQAYAPSGIGNNVGRYLTGSIWHSLLVAQHQAVGGFEGVPTDLMIDSFENQGIYLYQSRNMAGITGPVSAAKFYSKRPDNKNVREWMKYYYPRLAGLTGFSESTTDFKDAVAIDGIKRIEKKFREADHKKCQKIQHHLYDWAKASDSEVLRDMGSIKDNVSGAMLRGTCRMGNDPSQSAVSPEGKLYGYSNIYVSDASVIGRGMIADPSLFIQIFSHSLGVRLAEELKSI